MSPKDATKQAVFGSCRCAGRNTSEWCSFCRLAGVLFPLVHFLLELLCLLLVDEAQGRHTFFQLKGVEEGPILVVDPRVEQLLIPYHSLHSRLYNG